jgi:ChaB protein
MTPDGMTEVTIRVNGVSRSRHRQRHVPRARDLPITPPSFSNDR